MNIINLTENASAKARELLDKQIQDNPEAADAGLHISVIGGGCSGLSYDLRFAVAGEDDLILEQPNGLRVFIDPKSAPFLAGSTLEYHEGLAKSGFEVINPNSSNTCGCGQSFSP